LQANCPGQGPFGKVREVTQILIAGFIAAKAVATAG